MALFTGVILSGSTNGRNIKVVQTATPGTLIHTAISGTSSYDEIYLYAHNTDTSDRKLTIEFGGVSSPDDLLEFTVPAEAGAYFIIAGYRLQNSLVVRAFCATGSVVMINGYVNRVQ